MFAHTNTRWAPWTVIDANDETAGCIAALTAIADQMEKAMPAEPPAMGETIVPFRQPKLRTEHRSASALIRDSGSTDDLVAFLAGGQADDALVADPGADQRPGDRGGPADPAGRGIGLILADQGQDAALVVLVGQLDGRAEADRVALLLPCRDRPPWPIFITLER